MRNRVPLVRLIAAMGLFGCAVSPCFGTPSEALPVYRDASRPVAERVEDLLGRMTVEEKILQLGKLRGWNAYVRGADGVVYSNAFEKGFATNPPGTVYGLFRAGEWTDRLWDKGARPEDAADILDHFQRLAVEKSRLGIPVLFVEEAPHGLYVNGGTFYPTPIGLGATFDADLLRRIGEETAREALGRGVRCVYGPVVDIAHDPRWSRVEECFGEDPELVARLGAAMTEGLVGSGVQPCVKHFLGGGASEGGHNTLSAHLGPYELYNVELRPWRRCIAAGARHVMSTYHDVDGEHCTTSPWMLTTLLREHLGFDGFVTSDAGATEIAVRRRLARDVNDAAAKALRAGCDTTCGYWSFADCGDIYRRAYAAGAIDESDLDRAVRRVLSVKFAMGLFERPYADRTIRLSNDAPPTDLAREAAEKSLVLLKNAAALPLAGGSVAVIGPNADAPMNQMGEYVTPPRRDEDVETVLEGVRRFVPTAAYAKGCAVRDPSKKGFAEAERLAAEAETTILVLGGSSAPVPHTMIDPLTGATVPFRETDELFDRESGEGTDRCTLTLSGVQAELFRAVRAKAKRLVTVLVMGRPLEIAEVLEKSDAVLLAWYPGSRGGEAVANALFGQVNPSGRLPISWPRTVGQTPVSCLSAEAVPPTYVDGPGEALLPFGFGLSYTTFGYENLTAERTPEGVRVTVDVVNTGKTAGEESVLFYLTALRAPRQRPARELFAFARTARLAPGERTRVSALATSAALGGYDREGRFVPGDGDYAFTVGTQTVSLAAPARRVLNVVNFVRALDPRQPKAEYLRALDEEVKLNRRHGFPNTILLQYDALVDEEMLAVARTSDPAKTEFGLWFEMSRPLNAAAGLAWRPTEEHKGWDWDWFINPGFLMAYDREGRRKLIDAAFAKFKETFGHYPKSVGSWLIDVHSMDYMVARYGVDGFCICREQDSTDAYGLRGGYSNGAYYPSKKNMLSAAVDMRNAVRAPVFKMLTPDPIYNYGLPGRLYADYPYQGCPTMEPVWSSGFEPRVVDWFFRVYTEPKGLLNLSYLQAGQENSFGWDMISKGWPMQCAKIAAEAAAGHIVVETMGETARRFKREHPANCPQTQIALEDWNGGRRKSVWYNSRFYRANLFLDGGRLAFRDIHKMADDFEEPFLDEACSGWQALYFTPPVVDKWLFRDEGASGEMALSGTYVSLAAEALGRDSLVVTAMRSDGTTSVIRFEEGRVVLEGCDLSSEYAPAFRQTLRFGDGEVGFVFSDYRYRLPVEGCLTETEKGFALRGETIVLDLSAP